MIHIYKADSVKVRQETNLNNLLRKLPENMHERAKRYKFENDAFNFVLGRLLLKRGLSDLAVDVRLDDIAYRKSGKPFLKNIFFNISHTEGMVVCAFSSEAEIGVDIEKIKDIKLSDFEAWFTNNEWVDIHNSSSPLQKFYWYWTRKESIIKALGTNLSDLHRIEVDSTKDHFTNNGKSWFLNDLDFGTGYYGALCTEFEITEMRIIDVSL